MERTIVLGCRGSSSSFRRCFCVRRPIDACQLGASITLCSEFRGLTDLFRFLDLDVGSPTQLRQVTL
eukprot:scaffold26711_cov196-Skeletonema_menzelii.AAC.5